MTAALSGAMVILLITVSLVSFRQFSLSTAQDHVRSAAEIVRVGLTELMINGVIDQREQFLTRLDEVDGLLDARVMRAPEVMRQFGKGLESEQAVDEIEKRVLATGQPYFGIVQERTKPIFRGTIPFVATRQGTPNCLACHQVKDGTVLGAITIHISMGNLQRKALNTIGVMVIIVIVFAAVFTLLFRKIVAPVVRTATGVQQVVAQARNGDFRGRIDYQGADEIGGIAQDLNWLMNHLQNNLGAICQDVARLMNYKLEGNTNLVSTTTDMVENLLQVAQFKQAVEEDQTIHDVYLRLARMLQDQFDLKWFSIYEVTKGGEHIKPVMVNGEQGRPCQWCSSQILIQADACRARRTGHAIDSFNNQYICNYFKHGQETSDLGHICIPVFHSGMVGTVVQMMVPRKDGHLLQRLQPFIRVFLRESAPTVEARRLLDSLRESALRDALTGLHNRRFLEEYVETLVATTRRKKQRLSVLLMDLDHFKQVNDNFGHDVGDEVLKALSRVLQEQVRTSDLVIRYGGEEFLVILQESDDYSGYRMAEKIRQAVEAMKIQISSGILRKTISIGVAGFPADGSDVWEVIKCADIALYQAKEQGRNRVVLFKPEMATESADTP